ncbi:hypothetical protein JW758_05960 [Candidatus Peregrinibacteria bacterium]|nr:hypothetical protein [Candidatus Peregrinibacteria bacterium]
MENLKTSKAKAENANRILNALTELEKEEISTLLNEIKSMHGYANELLKQKEAGKICRDCEGECCKRTVEEEMVYEIDYFLAFTEMAEEERAKVIEALEIDGGILKCRLSSNNGCLLPENARPVVCKAYFCEKSEILEDELIRLMIPVISKYLQLQFMLKTMGHEIGGPPE